MFQVLGPLYSETWFDLKARTTATMLLSICELVVTQSILMFDSIANFDQPTLSVLVLLS